jgi:hypothetical protein
MAFSYYKRLVEAGWRGVASARSEAGSVFTPAFKATWTPVAIGTAVGVLSAGLVGKRKSASSLALGGLVGTLVGFGAAAGWESRRFAGVAARRATRMVNGVRDSHWLEQHPVAYG